MFRSRRKVRADSHVVTLIEHTYKLVWGNLTYASATIDDLPLDPMALGMVYGTLDAFLQRGNINDEADCNAALLTLFQTLANDDKRGALFVKVVLDMQDLPEFQAGAMVAGSSLNSWLQNGGQGDPPMELCNRIKKRDPLLPRIA